MQITQSDLKTMDRVRRLNIINSISGIKPANLIGTTSKEHGSNLAIFSSIVHLGSNPAYLGFITRPIDEVPRNTYSNILENGYYTINHIPQDYIEQAHYTSAKFEAEVSEFAVCGLTEEYLDGFPAPFVKESAIKIGMKFVEQIPIPLNGTIMMIGAIEQLIVPEEAMGSKGLIDLASVNDVGIGGLNAYYSLKKVGEFPYARVAEVPVFDKK